MAIDFKTIAKTIYGGRVPETPFGIVGPDKPWYYTPYDEWPADIKAGYTYNPEGAKKLLAEAGYPNGFKSILTVTATSNMDLLQACKSYWADVGIDVQINIMDAASCYAYIFAGKHEMDSTVATVNWDPDTCITARYSLHMGFEPYHTVKDPVYDAMVDRFKASLDQEEQKKILIEADNYAIAQQWCVNNPVEVNFDVYQPYIKRYHGEAQMLGRVLPYLWIDQDLKKSMVH